MKDKSYDISAKQTGYMAYKWTRDKVIMNTKKKEGENVLQK